MKEAIERDASQTNPSVTNLAILLCACANFSWKNVVKDFTLQKMKTLLAHKKSSFLGDTQHKRNYYDTKYLFHHLKPTCMQLLSNKSLEMFLYVMEETPHEKHRLSGDSKPSSGMALGMFGLTMAGYGHKQTCSQIRPNYRLSFK